MEVLQLKEVLDEQGCLEECVTQVACGTCNKESRQRANATRLLILQTTAKFQAASSLRGFSKQQATICFVPIWEWKLSTPALRGLHR